MQTPKVAGNTLPSCRTWLKRTCIALLVAALAPGVGRAQATRDGAVFLKQSVFKIPIQVAPDKQDLIRELHLFVSTDRGNNWQRIQSAQPTEQAFTFKAQTDGEYWFTLAYVDHNGAMEPEDISSEPPGLKVVVDTTPPKVDVQQERDGGRLHLQWRIDDNSPNAESMSLEIKATDESEWQQAPIRPGVDGEIICNVDPRKSYQVRARIRDQAGNETVREFAAAPGGSEAATTAEAEQPRPRRLDLENNFEMPAPPPLNSTSNKPSEYAGSDEPPAAPATARSIPKALPNDVREEPETAATPSRPWSAPRAETASRHDEQRPVFDRSRTARPVGWSRTDDEVVPAAGSDASRWAPAYATRIPIASTREEVQRTAAVAKEPPKPQAPKPHLSASRRIEVNYAVRGAGPAGIGKVELWYTQDNGETWKLFGEDPDKTPPFEVELPSEGRYGLQVVVTSLAGFGQRPPRSGDVPQLVIEVDTTAPTAEMYQPVPDTQAGKDRLLLHWSASDKHLPEQPVSLYFATEPNGELYEIADGLDAEGSYSWQVPKDIPYQVYLVLIAKDMAGNMSKAVTPEPIVVDLSQPEAEVIGVVAVPEDNVTR